MRLRAFSLRRRLALGMGLVGLLAVTAATIMLGLEYRTTNNLLRDNTLQGDAELIADSLHWQAVNGRLLPVVPNLVMKRFSGPERRFAIVDADGALLAGSSGLIRPLIRPNPARDDDFFALETLEAGRHLVGISMPFAIPGMPAARGFWVQVAVNGNEDLRFDSLFEDFVSDIAWIWIPFILVLIAVNLAIIHYGLRPLRRASAFAAAIGPATVSIRLPESEMPREMLPLVQAVNHAFDRLGAGYEAQQAFIADAAHELRTPLAVLKVHLALLPDRAAASTLAEDVEAMERLVNQLLDLARAGNLELAPDERADLGDLAADVAAHLAPLAIRNGRSIEVEAVRHPLEICGSYDFLFRALSNLVENALIHTPVGTAVIVEAGDGPMLRVIDRGPGILPEMRHTIFQRFWQGTRDRGGAGLGLAIVARTMAAHGARITIEDVPGSGAAIRLDFPKPGTIRVVD